MTKLAGSTKPRSGRIRPYPKPTPKPTPKPNPLSTPSSLNSASMLIPGWLKPSPLPIPDRFVRSTDSATPASEAFSQGVCLSRACVLLSGTGARGSCVFRQRYVIWRRGTTRREQSRGCSRTFRETASCGSRS
eukprot:2161587-Pleurochrysis_carterae.AAC.1